MSRLRRLAAAVLVAAAPPAATRGEPTAMEHQAAYARYHEALEARDLEEALEHARDAYLLAVDELGPRDRQTGILAYNLGAVQLQLGHDRDALKSLEVALPIYRAASGRGSPQNLTLLLKLAEANQRLARWQPAERHYVGAVQIIERTRGRDDDEIGLILVELGLVATELGAYKRVRTYGVRAINIFEQTRGENELMLGLVHLRLAHNELELGDGAEALRHLRRGEEIVESQLPPDDSRLPGLYDYMAEIADAAGKPARARGYRKSAKESRERTGGESSPR